MASTPRGVFPRGPYHPGLTPAGEGEGPSSTGAGAAWVLSLPRVEAVAPSDYQQELSLVRTLVQGPRTFLSREEAQHFLKE